MASVLILEDEILVALDLEMTLDEFGMEQVHVTHSADQALAVLDAFEVDLAIVDFNLGAQTSEPVLRLLEQRAIPFVVMTGYTHHTHLGSGAEHWPLLSKPATPAALRAMIATLGQAGLTA